MLIFLIGFGFMVQGGVMAILYLNLMPQSFDVVIYITFIMKQTSCQLFFIGLLLVGIGIKKLERFFRIK